MPRAERATPYGNYKGYYTKRGNQTSDPRLKVLSPDLFKGKRVLDIGCNEASRYEAKEVVGVDIDAELVSRAWRRRRDVWSLQMPGVLSRAAPVDTLEEEHSVHVKNDIYFPECFPSLFGPVPIPPQHPAFPNNVSFHQSDWANQGCTADKLGYNVVVAFSVSKWIHVHGGDEGIKRFFSRVRDVLAACATETSPGIFVLEAQPWTGYHSAHKPFGSLKLTPNEFPGLLMDLGFSKPQCAGIIGEGGFKRPIDVYELHIQ
ncbi:unnamed protein product [Rhizoctonia solani]|uniref:RNA methyltransferase n=1 Tax=Rhizoctonia solani TaxID=456999 RepID=A0A8H2X5L2_9AGAM|nr:unnamed protein product [Rhizoctonia solani]